MGTGAWVGACAIRFASSFLTWAVTVAGMSGVGMGRPVGGELLQATSSNPEIRTRAVSLTMHSPSSFTGIHHRTA